MYLQVDKYTINLIHGGVNHLKYVSTSVYMKSFYY